MTTTFPQPPVVENVFQITAATMEPAAFTSGDILKISVSLKNVSGTRLTIGRTELGYLDSGGIFTPIFGDMVGLGVSNGASTFFAFQKSTGRGSTIESIDEAINLHALCTSLTQSGTRAANGLTLRISATDSSATSYSEMYPLSLSYAVFNRHYTPSIPVFEVGRYDAGGQDDDGGEYVWVTSTISDGETPPSGTFSASIAYAQDAEPDATSTTVDLTASIPDLLVGVTKDKTLVTATFSGNHDWYFRLTYGDEYESASALTSIGIAFAVLHLSGASTGGVALGMFSTATEGNPKFQVNPDWAVEMGGGSGGESYDTTAGEVDTGATWTDGDGTKPIYKQIFSSTGAHTSFGSIGTIADFDKLIRMDGHVKTNANWLPIWYSAGSTYASARVSTAGAVNVIFTGSGTPTFVVIVYYTKT